MILVYLGLLALAAIIAPQITHWIHSLVDARFASFLLVTVPVSLYFVLSEASGAQATFGKRWLGIHVQSWSGRRLSLGASLIRTALKFTPWEFGHASTWRFIFAGGDTVQVRIGIIYSTIAWSLLVFYLICLVVDKRHRAPYDFVARSVCLLGSVPKTASGTLSPREPWLQAVVVRHPAGVYFVITFAISWTGALLVAAPALLRSNPLPKTTGLMMFPIMILGPCLTGIALNRIAGGASTLHELFARMRRIRLGPWYAGLLIPPSLILIVLLFLKTFVSRVYAPNKFFIGITFGVVAGFLEEIGWMGFAFPALSAQRSELSAAVLLGSLWGFWHLPVIDFLGTASPHGAYLIEYFLAFIAVMTAMRVVIAWLFTNTKSLFLAQLMHVSSTGWLVALSPPLVTAGQEAIWYFIYAGILWLFVALVVSKTGVRLRMQRSATAVC